MSRRTIYLSVRDAFIRGNGTIDHPVGGYSLTVPFEVHSGPKETVGRHADLIVTPEEAVKLAIDLLNAVPITFLTEHPTAPGTLKQLDKMVRMLQSGLNKQKGGTT